jgi:putative hemolysin
VIRGWSKLVILILVSSHLSFAEAPVKDCPSQLDITSESGKPLRFCKTERYWVSEACFQNKKECKLLQKLKNWKRPKEKAYSGVGNPGSALCHELKWKVLMSKMFDGSSVCTCQHPSGESVICTSLL